MRSLALIALIALSISVDAADRFEFQDGDRVVLIGSTLIEREQRYGYWETALVAAHPDKNITFRNLGWSGDTVWGEARALFESPREGYKRLIEHTLAEKPTVIIVGYGTNESFGGEGGLTAFKLQFRKLLDDLAPAKARLILLAPPLPPADERKFGNADDRNRQITRYAAAIQEEAKSRGALFVENLGARDGPASPWTDNGLHPTAWGYRHLAFALVNELRLPSKGPESIEFRDLQPIRFEQKFLPSSPFPPLAGDRSIVPDTVLKIRGLKSGRYQLQIDRKVVPLTWIDRIGHGQPPVDEFEWKDDERNSPLALGAASGPSLEQVERLRRVIIAKNELYFHRWRPQNVTYLYLFRKHEQGMNAVEIPRFDPLVAEKEKEIAVLRMPVPHVYQLVPVK